MWYVFFVFYVFDECCFFVVDVGICVVVNVEVKGIIVNVVFVDEFGLIGFVYCLLECMLFGYVFVVNVDVGCMCVYGEGGDEVVFDEKMWIVLYDFVIFIGVWF